MQEIYDLKRAITTALDDKVNASIVAAWSAIISKMDLANVVTCSSLLLTWIIIFRQLYGIRKDFRGGKQDVDS